MEQTNITTTTTTTSSSVQYRGSAVSGVSAATTPVRPGTPESRSNNNPFSDEISPAPRGNPFSSPFNSRPASSFGSSSAVRALPTRYFHSRRVRKGEVEQPWRTKVDPKEKWVTIIPVVGLILGFAIAGFLVYDGISSVVHHKYCPVMDEDFSEGLNPNIWTKEVEVGGFGNGEFEQTTDTDENVFVQNGKLIIKPTLQDATLIESDYTLNLTGNGCTAEQDFETNCVTITNTTLGTIVQPVKSGRINTKASTSIKYGKVEVTAKLPAGDWLWPAIWMMPVNNTYGAWPASGEIDIVESRGNNHTYAQGGNNIISSAMHWGADPANDNWWRTNVKRSALHTTYAAKEHTFGLEWSQKYLFTYIDTLLLQVLYTNFDEALWQRGSFSLGDANSTAIKNQWAETGLKQTPFDQPFYLILNVAVGGTNGWFNDGASGKPWVDTSPTAKLDFWNAQKEWLPTWTEGGQMEVSSVKMWQQCDGNEAAEDIGNTK